MRGPPNSKSLTICTFLQLQLRKNVCANCRPPSHAGRFSPVLRPIQLEELDNLHPPTSSNVKKAGANCRPRHADRFSELEELDNLHPTTSSNVKKTSANCRMSHAGRFLRSLIDNLHLLHLQM